MKAEISLLVCSIFQFQGDGQLQNLTNMLKILRHICCYQSCVRHILAIQESVLLELFALAIQFVEHKSLLFEVATVFTLLLFDDVIVNESIATQSIEWKLPDSLNKR